MLINPDRRLLFLHNQKCAGTSVTKRLLTLGFAEVHEPLELDASGTNWRHSFLIPEDFIDFTVFCTVRHPYDVCLSYWRFSVDSGQTNTSTLIEWLEKVGAYVPHQTWYISKCQHFYYAERLHECDLVDLSDLPHLNQSSSHHYLSELNTESRRLIWCMFRDDFTATGYKP